MRQPKKSFSLANVYQKNLEKIPWKVRKNNQSWWNQIIIIFVRGSLSFQFPEIILLLIGWTYRIIGILVSNIPYASDNRWIWSVYNFYFYKSSRFDTSPSTNSEVMIDSYKRLVKLYKTHQTSLLHISHTSKLYLRGRKCFTVKVINNHYPH